MHNGWDCVISMELSLLSLFLNNGWRVGLNRQAKDPMYAGIENSDDK